VKHLPFSLALVLLGAAAPAAAVDETALRACRAVADDDERLACYDRELDREDRAAAAAESAAAPNAGTPPPAPPAPVTAEERFGRERAIAAEEREREQRSARELGELKALVTKIETRIDGLMTITLDNGQVWRQNAPDSRFRLKVGDPVSIQPGALRSFLMSGPTNRSTRVTRVK
jgi:hypothetical protein